MAKDFSVRRKEWDSSETDPQGSDEILEGAIKRAKSGTVFRDWAGVLIGGFFAIIVAYLHSTGKSGKKSNSDSKDGEE